MIEIRDLSKHFGSFRAVDDISFKVSPGEVLGFLGPNGAGKSTTMKMITGFLAPTRGSISVLDFDVASQPIEAKNCIGYLPEGAPLYPDMTPLQLLRFAGSIRGLQGSDFDARLRTVVEQVQLGEVIEQRIETLSKGFKRRVGLALAILHDPQVLILDEPTDGLDPNQKHDVRRLIRDMSKEKVIVLSTHILEEVDSVCTRAIIIAAGRLCFDGTPRELRTKSSYYNAVQLTLLSSTAPGAEGQLKTIEGVERVESVVSSMQQETEGLETFTIYPASKDSIVHAVSDFVHSKGWEVEHLHVEHGRLDDVFRDITEKVARA